jgi:hypothetical protein
MFNAVSLVSSHITQDLKVHESTSLTGQGLDVLSGQMCEHLGVYSHAILAKGIQAIWNLD